MKTRISIINAEAQKILSRLIPTLKDPRISGLISVSRVEVSGDHSVCKCYISTLENSGEVLKGLRNAAGYLRRELGSELGLRLSPELVFLPDDSIKEGARILTLIEKLNKEKEVSKE